MGSTTVIKQRTSRRKQNLHDKTNVRILSAYLAIVLLLTARVFTLMFQARHISALAKFVNSCKCLTRISPSWEVFSAALKSADVAADLHSVNSSFIRLKSTAPGSDYAGSQTPSMRVCVMPCTHRKLHQGSHSQVFKVFWLTYYLSGMLLNRSV